MTFDPNKDPLDPTFIITQNAANDSAVPPNPGVTVTLQQLPTADPHVAGRIWNNDGEPVVSNG